MTWASAGWRRPARLLLLVISTPCRRTSCQTAGEATGGAAGDIAVQDPGCVACWDAQDAERRRLNGSRALQGLTYTMPTTAAVYMEEQGGTWSKTCYPGLCASVTDVGAGVLYSPVELRASVDIWSADYAAARLNVVDGEMDTLMAQSGNCLAQYKDGRFVEGSWSPNGVETTPRGTILAADEPLLFRMGGSYRLCYSADGSFGIGQADVARVKIDVNGVFDTSPGCSSDTCLASRRYECYLMKRAFSTEDGSYGLTTSCVLDFSYAGAGFTGPPGAATWSAEFATSGYSAATGAVGPVTPEICGTRPATFICNDGGACDAGDALILPDSENANKRVNVPTARNDLEGNLAPEAAFRPRSVAACYCPARGGCDDRSDFVQQIGVLHFYLSKVCHAKDTNCELDRNGVTAQYRFKIRVECPTDACAADSASRVKLVAHQPANDLPSWNSLSGCSSATHGLLDGRDVFALLPFSPIDGSVGGYVNEAVVSMTGGSRQDYKVFGGTFGFRALMGSNVHEARNFHSTKRMDVCYCNGDCGAASSWFKVGAFRLAPTRLVSAATSRSNLRAQWAIEFVNQPGVVGLERQYADADVLGLQENALIKIATDTDKALRDDGCAFMGYSSQLTDGPADPVAASMNFLAKRQTQTPLDLKKLVFNSDFFVNTITVKQAGTVAVCYCAITTDGMCLDAGNWKLLAHVQIRGPKVNQRWLFSTNVVFRFSFEGYGLSPHDTVRIISADGSCTANNFNPNTAAFAYTSLKVKCPQPCTEVTPVNGPEVGDLPASVLSADTWGCDEQNAACQHNDITAVVAVSDSETELTFQQPPGVLDGDEVTLGDNIECDPTDATCTPEILQAVKGVFDFADRQTNTPQAPDTYIAPHRVALTSNPFKIRIKVGWPSPRPRFVIAYSGAQPDIGYIGRGGKWTHHSRAITREEVFGVTERANLRVCWKFGGDDGKFVEEVGKVTIRNPAPMEGDILLSMSTTLLGQKAPMVLTFRTATGVTGQRYEEAIDSLRLKIVFTRTDLVDIQYSNLAADDIPFDVPSEDEPDEASQAVCGKLFLELWSNDMERGFPLPRGCYYKGYPITTRREIFLVFEGKTGLRGNTVYQLVFNGVVKDLTVEAGGQYMEIFPMDDIVRRPYEAIERGIVTMTSTPQSPPNDIAHPRFRCVDGVCDGFKIVGGYNDLLQLRSGDSLVTELMGDPTAGRIKKNNIIRIFLWPLTQWQTTSTCTAECVTGGEVSFLCGTIEQCVAYPAVPGMSLNVLKLTLPDPFEDLYGNKKIRIRIGGVTIPAGGFFANHLPAQLTKEDDTRPHYVLSVGDYIWKEPNLGQTVAKVISPAGGGNLRPYRGDRDNTLYARFILASTILARDDIGTDASFTLTLPPGYTCLDKTNPSDPTLGNAWEAETTLPAFGNVVPQGRGTPDDGSPTRGWSVSANTCTYRPAHPHGVVFAGSSMVVKVSVNNPATALQRSDPTNAWTIHMTNKGLHRERQVTQPFPFLSPPDMSYQTTNAVLGKITEASCQPSTFAASARRAVEQDLRFFFRTEQEVGSGGLVRVFAPEGFNFGEPCNATDLEDPYYATQANPGDATLRLPGIVSCTTIGAAMAQADIRLSNILAGGRLFGFRLRVSNPQGFDLAQTQDWRIFTADASDFLVDGTPSTVPFLTSDGSSWGIYNSQTLSVFIKIPQDDMLPYSMSNTPARVTVLLQNVPAGASDWMRFIAPEGYVWDFADSQFAYDPLLGGLGNVEQFRLPRPRDGSNVLLFAPASFAASRTYGFTALARIPEQEPTTAANSFYFEMGFNSTATGERPAAAAVPAPPVRALRNAAVDYTTTIFGKENNLQLQIETVTQIPEGGGIEIVAPEDFTFDGQCQLIPARDPAAGPPPDLRCASWVDPNRGVQGRPVVTLTAGPEGLRPGLYAFAIIVGNPMATTLNFATTDTQCGTFICWSFGSYRFPSTPTAAAAGLLDAGTLAQGFSIQQKMLEAQLPGLSEEQRRATGRDDRPLQPNSLIFAFKLDRDARTSGELLLRGPFGFVFAEECLSGVVVSEGAIFGLGNRFPPEYAVWPSGVAVSQCRGRGQDARLTLTMAPGAFLQGSGSTGSARTLGALYLLRIQTTVNPLVTPNINRWTIELNGESSEPIEGFKLWAFTRTNVEPMTTARDRTLAGAIRTKNPLRISLRPFNTLVSGGELRAEAPLGFQFVSLPSRECDVQLQELPYSLLGISYPGYVWPEEGLICLVDRDDPRRLSVQLRDPRDMSAGLDYLLILTVYNPSTIVDPGPTVWKISSYKPGGLSLDESRITSFVINPVMNLWAYTNPDPENPGEEVRNGGSRLPAFTLQMRFPGELVDGDLIEVISPPGFLLADSLIAAEACRGFRWVGPPGTDDLWSPLPYSRYTCDGNTMRITVEEPVPIPRDTLIEIGLEQYNPLRTPDRDKNFWRCTLFASGGAIKSSKAFQGWDIIPQLEALDVQLIGPNYAAESTSAIRIAFTAVSSAEDLAIQVLSPSNFVFDAATIDDPSQEIFLTSGPLIRVRMAIAPDRRYGVTLRGVLLGREGGQTTFVLTTWRGGMLQSGTWIPGEKRDERLNYKGGFRLPGQVVVRYDKLENTFQQDPVTYPVQSLWLHQMGRPAYAEFHFYLTRAAEVGDLLQIYARPFEPTSRLFRISEAPQGVAGTTASTARRSIQNQVIRLSEGEVRTKMLEPLVPYRVYEMVISVIAPSAEEVDEHGGPIRWTLSTTDGGKLPVNTNDGNSREFPIVEEYYFQVEAARSPPDAEIEVSLIVVPGLHPPTELRVVAPLLYNFSAGCLVAGGRDVLSCRPGNPMPDGRKVAILSCNEDGIRGQPEDLRIIVRTPPEAPVDETWFIEGLDFMTEAQLGWGEAAGIQLMQMSLTSVTYPGVPNVMARMVWRFRTQVMVQAGGYLQLSLPPGLRPSCQGNLFEPISLPNTGGCDARDPENVLVFLNSTIVPAEYTFAIYVTPPVTQPVRNEISIRLRDRFGEVQDAAVNIPGKPIQDKLRIRVLDMFWTSSKPNRPATVTVGFEIIDPLPDLVIAPEQQVSEILITMPEDFSHLIERETDFTVLNEDMPFATPTYLEFKEKDRLRVFLNLNRTSWTTLKVASYSFRFTVLVPDPLPIFNVWHLALCQPNFPGGCSRITDPSVLVTFAMPGFGLNQAPAGGYGVAAGARGRLREARAALLALALAGLLAPSSWRRPC